MTIEPVGKWRVQALVTRLIDVECSDCTEEQARANPLEHADWDAIGELVSVEVLNVEGE